jgi:hypothetical protein
MQNTTTNTRSNKHISFHKLVQVNIQLYISALELLLLLSGYLFIKLIIVIVSKQLFK